MKKSKTTIANKSFLIILTIAILLISMLAFIGPLSAHPDVTVTDATGGEAISADDVATGTYTPLGTITIAEGAAGDIGTSGDLILDVPDGFLFDDTAPPSVTVQVGSELVIGTVTITTTQITIPITVEGTIVVDTITIGETTPIKIIPSAGTPLTSGNIYADTASVDIVGITEGSAGTNFGTLNEVAGALHHFLVVTDATKIAGTAFSVTITAQDQFDNTVTDYIGAHTIAFTSTATAAPDGTEPTIPAPETISFSTGVGTSTTSFILTRVGEEPTITATEDVISGTSDPIFVEGINLDSKGYRTGGTVTVTVGDKSENKEPTAREVVAVKATSDTIFPDTITVSLKETDVDTAIFMGSFKLVGVTPGTGELLVSTGDTITVTYPTDSTLEVSPLNTATVDDVSPVFVDPYVTGPDFCKNDALVTLTAYLTETGLTVTADFSAIDSEYTAGEESVSYTGDGVKTYEITYTIAAENTRADGTYTIPVTAEDVAGNWATWTEFSTALDNTPPSVTEPTADPSVIQPNTATDVVLTASVSDDVIIGVTGSGVQQVTIDCTQVGKGEAVSMLDDGVAPDETPDDGIYTAKITDVTVSEEGLYNLTITATDVIGNVNATEKIVLRVITDTEGPVIVSIEVEYPIGAVSARPGEPVVVSAVVTDVLAGVKSVTIDATEIGLGSAVSMLPIDADTYSVELTVQPDTTAGTKNLTITAKDLATNDNSTIVQVEVTLTLTAYNIQLVEGWNLISLPLIPDDPSITVVLADIAANVDKVWAYDNATWFMYSPAAPEISDLTKMVDGKGYWINMTAAATLTIHGVEVPLPPETPHRYKIVPGWNLIGYKEIDPMSAEDYLAGITGKYVTIYEFVDGVFHRITATDDMVPGRGYWIAVTEEGWIYP